MPQLVLYDYYMWKGIYKKEFLIKNNIKQSESSGAAFQDNGFLFKTIAYSEKAIYLRDSFYFYRRDNTGSSVYNEKAYGFQTSL